MTSSAIADLLSDSRHVGLVPVGATEQHGPHLPTGTDTLIANHLCDRVSERTGALVLPSVSVGVSAWHGSTFCGTLSVPASVLVSQVSSVVSWSRASGLKRLIFVNGHIGNVPSLDVALDELRSRRERSQVGVRNWWSLPGKLASEVNADAHDWHANRAETSIMLAIHPELVDTDAAVGAADADRSTDLVFSYTAAELTKNGVTGDPSTATAELGRQLISAAVDHLADLVLRGHDESPPLGPRQ